MKYPLLALYAITALTWGAAGARNLIIPLDAIQLNASRGTVGLLFSTFTITAAIVSLPSGVMADRFGRRNMLVVSLLLFVVSQLVAGLTQDVRVLFATQLVAGIGGGASQTAVTAALADLVPLERIGGAMGWLTMSMQSGFLAGPALAGILLGWLTLQQDLLVTTLALGIALGLSLLVPAGGRKGAKLDVRKPVLELAAQSGFLALVLGVLATTLVWGTYQAYLPIFAKLTLGLTGTQVGYLLAIQAFVNGMARIPAGRLLDRVRRKGAIVSVATLGFAGGLVMLPHLRGFWAPTALLVIIVPMIATALIAVGIAFVQISATEKRGAAMGVNATISFLGQAAGPALFAPLMDRSFVAGFSTCAVVGALFAGLALVARQPSPGRERVTAIPPTP